jgi:glutamate-ammonia-ligase adenylyltransferase
MPAAVELFSILKSNRAVLSLFADILGSAPRLANVVANRPHLLDAVIDPAFGTQFGDVATLEARLSEAVGEPDLLEDMLDRLREAGQHEIFLVGARMLSGSLSPALAGQAYADVAEAIIRVALKDVTRRFAAEYGYVPGGRLCVVGMGRLGSREMTATSDLDLVVLYDFNDERAESEGGARSLAATTYFTRLTQRLISALTVPTRKGTLYEVDMRLRPSGNKGPAATQWKGFRAYQSEEAETWEAMALTRARPLAGDPDFVAEVNAELHAILCRKRNASAVKHDARTMRDLIAQEKGDDDPWDLKLARGGLMDIEFIAQVLVLTGASQHPALAVTSTPDIIARARKAQLIDANDGETLESAYALMRDVFQWQRLTFGADFKPDQTGLALRTRLAQAAGLPDFKVLASHLKETRAAVRAIFDAMMR